MSALEIGAALFGVVSVWLSTRENIWSWPTAIVNVGLYSIVFYQSRLYADMGLQVVYLLLSVYGWYEWLFGGERRTRLRVSRASPRLLLTLLVLNIVTWIALASALHQFTDAALPWLDSLLTTTSLVAQFLMTRKILENWLIWIAVDIAYVPMFISRGLYPTAVLYAVFLVLAFMGYRDWRRSLHHGRNGGPVPSADPSLAAAGG
jgi:nicotinamide mononucleotide transporter